MCCIAQPPARLISWPIRSLTVTCILLPPADGPDNSPDADGSGGREFIGGADDDGMMFELEDLPAPAAAPPLPQPAAAALTPAAGAAATTAVAPLQQLHAPTTGHALQQPVAVPHRVAEAPVPEAAAPWAAPPPLLNTEAAPWQPQPPPPQQQVTGEVLQGALPGTTIRKVIMRGRRGHSGVAKVDFNTAAKNVNEQAPVERRWVPPEWTSPARASQAA